ncbi:unnamed protein product [Cylindrotheca closterium]|uniref:Uncharacterized protein n=1 Tax=Cylindrotheca closterium TaxID=2856 RepID=A0AAD2FTI2_9STRA|nr:unnamed protein product [Cylindrotheca closterium]
MGVSSSSLVSISVVSITARRFSEVHGWRTERRVSTKRTEDLEKTLFAMGACGMMETIESMDSDSDLDQDENDLEISIVPESYCDARILQGNAHTDIPSNFVIISISGRIGDNDGKVEDLLRLLRDDSRKWKEMTIEGGNNFGETMSRAFLSVLSLAMIKVEKLCLKTWYSQEAFYECLMSGLASPFCVRNLELSAKESHRLKMRAMCWHHLAEGLAQTTALQSFSFHSERILFRNRFTTYDDISEVLVDGIARNTTIRHLKLQSGNLTDDNIFPRLMKSLQRYPKKLESLMLSSRKITTDHLKDLAGYLGHEKCSLKRFEICSSRLSEFPLEFCNIQNESVETLDLCSLRGWDDFVSVVCPKLSRLSTLILDGSNVMDLSPLDTLLCDETALPSLAHLQLGHTMLMEEALSSFAPKLPRMRHLRTIEFSIFQTGRILIPFLTLALKSKTLEMISCRIDDHALEADLLRVLNLNKAGRRGIEIMSSGSRPLDVKLWPLILKRCLTVKYVLKNLRGQGAEAELHDKIATDNLFLILRDHAYIFDAIRQQVSV